MKPQDHELHDESKAEAIRPLRDPARANKSLAIALVVAGVFLVLAAGIITWIIMMPRNQIVTNQATDDVRDVKNVSLVPPADLPAGYTKNDQSKNDQVQVYYYDEASNCGFTVGVGDVVAGKSAKDSVTEAITAAQAQGITTTSQEDGDSYELLDADDADKSYEFSSVNLEQDVKVDGVSFTKQSNAILYKQFGNKIASLSYACKAESWTQKKVELATLVSKFTVKTER